MLITGATGGVGPAAARMALAEGAAVVATARSLDRAGCPARRAGGAGRPVALCAGGSDGRRGGGCGGGGGDPAVRRVGCGLRAGGRVARRQVGGRDGPGDARLAVAHQCCDSVQYVPCGPAASDGAGLGADHHVRRAFGRGRAGAQRRICGKQGGGGRVDAIYRRRGQGRAG